MKTTLLRKGAVVFLSLLTTASLMAIPTAAAPLEKDPPKGYATKVPGKNDAGVLTYQDFETDKLNDEGLIGKFSATEPDDTSISPAKIEVVSNVAHSGKKALKVSARGKSADGSPMGYNTLTYKDIGIDIAEKFVKDASNSKKTDTYFISAWVRNVDPSATQYFWLQLQYGGSAEVWLPGQTYFEVKGDAWTQIGIAVVDGKTYYVPFIEDTTKSGIYAPRNGVSTWSALKFITKNPKVNPTDTNEKVVQTNGDFYVDDIVIWKVDDASQLVKELPQPSSGTTTQKPVNTTTTSKGGGATKDESSSTTLAPADSSAPTDTTVSTQEGATTAPTNEASSGSATTTAPENKEDSGGLGVGAIVGIVVAAVVVLGGGGFALYWFKFRKH